MSDYDSWNAGITGQAPGPHVNWDSYNQGASIRAQTQAELSRRDAASSTPSFSLPDVPSWTAPTGGGGSWSHATQYQGPPYAPRKSRVQGVLLSVIFGPLGLFYSSTKGALTLLAAVAVVAPLAGESLGVVWPLGSLASIIWTILAVNAHNRQADVTDAASLAAWNKAQAAAAVAAAE